MRSLLLKGLLFSLMSRTQPEMLGDVDDPMCKVPVIEHHYKGHSI